MYLQKKIIVALIIVFGFSAKFSTELFCQYSNDHANALRINDTSLATLGITNVKVAYNEDNGKTYIAWLQQETSTKLFVYLQLLDKDGNFLWDKKPFLVTECHATAGNSADIHLQITSRDEAIVTTIDNSSTVYNTSVRYFKIDTNRNFLSEIEIYGSLMSSIQTGSNMIINENDELIFAISIPIGVLIGKVMPNGSVFSEDVTINGATNPLLALHSNGFYVVYLQEGGYYVDSYDNNFNTIWKATYVGNETAVGLGGANVFSTAVKPDGEDGIFIMWEKEQLYLQRINKQGDRLFDVDGIQISTNARNVASSVLAIDKQSKAVNVAWYSDNATKFLTLAQKISFDGAKLWGDDGVTLFETQSVSHLNYPIAIANIDDSSTLLVASIYDLSLQSYELVAANLTATGTNRLDNLLPINTDKSPRYLFNSTDYFRQQMVIVWLSIDSAEQPRVNAQNVSYYGKIGAGISEVADIFSISNALMVIPNPVNSLIGNSFSINYFSDFVQNAIVRIFDIEGKLQYLDAVELNQGENNLSIQYNLSKGMYYIELQTSHSKVNQTFIIK